MRRAWIGLWGTVALAQLANIAIVLIGMPLSKAGLIASYTVAFAMSVLLLLLHRRLL